MSGGIALQYQKHGIFNYQLIGMNKKIKWRNYLINPLL